MNIKLTYTAATVALVLTASSCSVFNGSKSNRVSGDSAQKVENTNKNNSSKPSKVDKTDKNSVNAGKESAKKKTDVASIASRLNGEWRIVQVGDTKVSGDEDMPYINFESSTGKFYSSNGCNILNGNYKVDGDKISFSGVISTMKYCEWVKYDSAITAVLSGESPVRVTITKLGSDYYLAFLNPSGKELMTAVRDNMGFLNGNWQIVSVRGKAINDEEATIFIDVPALKVHGNTGCNYFTGEIYINPDKSNAIDFSHMGLTRMACPTFEQEQAIMLALEETATALDRGDGNAILLDSAGKELMALKSIPLGTEE